MKLKDRPLEWWHGKKYTMFCRADINDTRKIHYTLNEQTLTGIETQRFTSDDFASLSLLTKVRNSRINDVKLIDNEWFVDLLC